MKSKDLTQLNEAAFRRIAFAPGYRDVIRASFAYLLQTCSAKEVQALWGCYHLVERGEVESDIGRVFTVIDSLKQGWYELCTKDDLRIVHKDQLFEALFRLPEDEAASVREVFPAECCGQVYYTPDNRIFIEAFRGGMKGLLEALSMPSYYVIDQNGTCCSSCESAIPRYYLFDERQGEWKLHAAENPETLSLSEEQLDVLCKLLGRLNPDRIFMKLNWVYSGKEFHIMDNVLPMGLGIAE